MLFLNWTRAAILYEDEYGLIRLQELVRFIPFACIMNTNTYKQQYKQQCKVYTQRCKIAFNTC